MIEQPKARSQVLSSLTTRAKKNTPNKRNKINEIFVYRTYVLHKQNLKPFYYFHTTLTKNRPFIMADQAGPGRHCLEVRLKILYWLVLWIKERSKLAAYH